MISHFFIFLSFSHFIFTYFYLPSSFLSPFSSLPIFIYPLPFFLPFHLYLFLSTLFLSFSLFIFTYFYLPSFFLTISNYLSTFLSFCISSNSFVFRFVNFSFALHRILPTFIRGAFNKFPDFFWYSHLKLS